MGSFTNQKASTFLEGRKNQKILTNEQKTLWFHCASLGEFEQAKPLMLWCSKNMKQDIILTFFSPSGFEIKKNYPLAKAVYYLPLDSIKNAQHFIQKINPSHAFFIKYEFWYFYLDYLKTSNIPHYLVAGIFRPKQIFFKPWGLLHKKMLQSFTHLFVQDENSLHLLNNIAIQNVSIANDTRFDAVHENAIKTFNDSIIENFINNDKCLIIGSSWYLDEVLLKEIISKLANYKIIIAPHEINKNRLTELESLFPNAQKYSQYKNDNSCKILIIDNIGSLSLMYRYADICYVGGGFNASVHNVLEAAVYGKAILFGPNHTKSKEAMDLIALGTAKSIKKSDELLFAIHYFEDEKKLAETKEKNTKYTKDKLGGTQAIIQAIFKV